MREGTPNSTRNFHLFRLLINVSSPQFVCCSSFSKMSSNKRASKHAVGSKGSKKKKQLQSTLFSDGDEILKGLNKAHKGKRLLIPAKVVYSGRVPFGQEDHLFQYSVLSVNSDHKSLVISYDERCISNGSDIFQDFPLYDENKETINTITTQ
jgi:hypothetical protein